MLMLTLFSLNVIAQEPAAHRPAMPEWLSDKGYWVIESNVKTPRNSIVHFYNNEHVVIYREKIAGVRINLNRKKTLFRLKQALEQAYSNWERKKSPNEDGHLVMNALRPN